MKYRRRGRSEWCRAIAAGMLLLAVSGCADDSWRGAANVAPELSPGEGVVGVDSGGSIDLATPLGLTDLELDLTEPVDAATVPGSSSMVVAERAGRVSEVVFDGATARLVPGPLLDLGSQIVAEDAEQGLLGVAVSPDGGSVVASFTAAPDGTSTVVRYDLEGAPGSLSIDPSSAVEVLSVEQPFPNHNGGHVVFGPDGMLYVGLGDGGLGGDPKGNSQNRRTPLGKILRLDVSGSETRVPDDNPFADGAEGARPEIWLTGVRNPWRFSFDRATGDLWVADVGQGSTEEVNVLPASDGAGRGANLGWDLYEGTEEFGNPDPAGSASSGPFVAPVHVYGHDAGCAVVGGLVYRGSAVPELAGVYLFGDFCTPGLRGLAVGGGDVLVEELDVPQLESVVGLAEAPNDEVIVLSLSDGMFLLRPGSPNS